MSKKIIIIGGAGKGGLVSQVIEDNRANFQDYSLEIAGFVNDYDLGKDILGYPVLGTIADIPRLLKEDYYFVFTIHITERNYKTEELFLKCNLPQERLATVISKRAFVAENAKLASGVCVMQFASISNAAEIGMCTMIGGRAFVGHNTKIGSLCHITATSVVGSHIHIGKAVTIGLHATVIEFCEISDYALIGACSMVRKKVGEGQVWVGLPARYLRDVRRD
jgi:acetyltransferase EpsM